MKDQRPGHLGISIGSIHNGGHNNNILDGLPPTVRVAVTVAFYMTAGLTLVLVNKNILNNNVKLPISLIFLQTLVCVLLIWALGSLKVVTPPTILREKCNMLLPLVIGNVIVLCLNTFCLQYVDASVFQIARGGTLPCTILAQFIINGKKTSPICIGAAVIIVAGFLTGLFEAHPEEEEAAQTRLGFLFGFLSSVGAAVNACYSAKGVEVVEGNTVHLVYYNQTMLLAALTPVWLFSGELHHLLALNTVDSMILGKNIIITGIFAFLINLAGFLQIKMTSPATHIVSGAVRGVLQTILGVMLLGEAVSTVRFLGVLVIIAGTSLYTYAKNKDI